MIGFRPKPSALFLERPRLLRLLPEEAGYVVWLEAPYGYGKSVLISQWVERLESEGWQVVWLSLVESNPREGLVRVLDLPENAPWPVVLGSLETARTVVVLEDLEPSAEGLGPLLKHNPGLVLLASRKNLREPELLRVKTEGRLVHLKAPQLAFTLEEATKLFGNTPGAVRAWEQTKGWSLPLHLAALTGEVPDEEGLWEGIRESLEGQEWQEALFLAGLPYLPASVADERTRRLVELGFVQALEGHYRLHPLAAEQLRERYPEGMRHAVRLEAHRLPVLMQGHAFEEARLWEELSALLETPSDLASLDPAAVVRWNEVLSDKGWAMAPSVGGRVRQSMVGFALCRVGQVRKGVELLVASARQTSDIGSALNDYGRAIYFLSDRYGDDGESEAIVLEAQPLLEVADPDDAASFLVDQGSIDLEAGRYAGAEAHFSRALALLPGEGSARVAAILNLAVSRWYQTGRLGEYLAVLREVMPECEVHTPHNVVPLYLWLGHGMEALGDRKAGLEYLDKAVAHQSRAPLQALEAQALAAIFRGQFAALPALQDRIEAWGIPELMDRVRGIWAIEMIEQGQAEEALKVLGDKGMGLCRAAKALAVLKSGESERALEILGEPLVASEDFRARMYWAHIRYRITREVGQLKDLWSRGSLLPGLIPIAELPRELPELSQGYPLEAVLKSEWKDAIHLRIDEIPPLEIDLLGKVEVRLLGQPVLLNPRPRDLLLLMVLGLPRGEIAEAVWPEVDPEKSRNNLHVTLNLLRKAIEPWGVATYLLESGLSRVKVDLWGLEEATRRRDSQTVRAFYAELAPGINLEAINERRESLRQEAIKVVLGARDEESLEWILQQDPLHEEAFGRLLEVWIGSGRKVTAERRYREFAKRLREELGMEPALQTQRMLLTR